MHTSKSFLLWSQSRVCDPQCSCEQQACVTKHCLEEDSLSASFKHSCQLLQHSVLAILCWFHCGGSFGAVI